MPERWQSELRNLRSVEMPPSLHDRIEAGPTGGPDPRPGSRVVAAVVAFLVFAAGGGFAWIALRPAEETRTPPVGETPEQVVVTLSRGEQAGSPYPRGTLAFGAETVDATFGSYSWCERGGGCGVADTATPELVDFVAVPVGTRLVYEAPGAVRITSSLTGPTFPFDDAVSIGPTADDAILEGDLGRHAMIVDIRWDDGEGNWLEAPLYFGIELVEPAVPTPTPTTSPPQASVSPPTPTPTTTATAWWDMPSELAPVGTVCGATSVDGDFGEVGVRAWVFEPEPEGGCAGPNENFQYIGIEGRNGELVMHSEELRECLDADPCWAFSAPDLDGDGAAEIAVGAYHVKDQEIIAFSLYRLERCPTSETCSRRLQQFEIDEPGDPHEGFAPGPVLFNWGGAAEPYGAYGVLCRAFEGDPAIVYWFTETYDQWMAVNGSHLRLIPGNPHIPEDDERLDDFCGAPVFEVPG